MTAGIGVLLALTCATWFNNALQWYTQFTTYGLFSAIADQTGDEGFVRYHKAYQKRLPATIYVPFGILMVLSVTALFVRPDELGVGGAVLLLVLNAAIGAISGALAAPVHMRVDRQGRLEASDAAALLRWNACRLAVATASSIAVTYFLVQAID
nr:hypothetical protein [uncultured bacterium]